MNERIFLPVVLVVAGERQVGLEGREQLQRLLRRQEEQRVLDRFLSSTQSLARVIERQVVIIIMAHIDRRLGRRERG